MDDASSDRCLKCVVKKAIYLRVGSPSVEFKSGCSVIDVTFPGRQSAEIDSLSFVNNYTASLSVKYKTTDSNWKICLKNFILMPYAHCEEGSQRMFQITSDQMLCLVKDALLVRFILRQPSPHWLNFSIENLSFFSPAKISPFLTDMLSSSVENQSDGKPEEEKKMAVNIAGKMQQMWAVAIATAEDTVVETGTRFDVDGCYDLNLLSYT